MEDKDLFIPQNQYHDLWWFGDAWSQGINSHGIDLILPVYFGLSTRRIDFSYFIEGCSIEFHVGSDNSDC